MPSEASATSTTFGSSFQDIITCDDEKLLEIRKKCVKWIKHIDFEASSRKNDEDKEILRPERETLRDAMVRGERARARDRVLADALGEGEGAGQAEGGDGDQGTWTKVVGTWVGTWTKVVGTWTKVGGRGWGLGR